MIGEKDKTTKQTKENPSFCPKRAIEKGNLQIQGYNLQRVQIKEAYTKVDHDVVTYAKKFSTSSSSLLYIRN